MVAAAAAAAAPRGARLQRWAVGLWAGYAAHSRPACQPQRAQQACGCQEMPQQLRRRQAHGSMQGPAFTPGSGEVASGMRQQASPHELRLLQPQQSSASGSAGSATPLGLEQLTRQLSSTSLPCDSARVAELASILQFDQDLAAPGAAPLPAPNDSIYSMPGFDSGSR